MHCSQEWPPALFTPAGLIGRSSAAIDFRNEKKNCWPKLPTAADKTETKKPPILFFLIIDKGVGGRGTWMVVSGLLLIVLSVLIIFLIFQNQTDHFITLLLSHWYVVWHSKYSFRIVMQIVLSYQSKSLCDITQFCLLSIILFFLIWKR